MKIVGLSDILRKETHLFYRREFKASATVEMMGTIRTFPVEFVLEHTPTGSIDINTTIHGDTDFPVMPVLALLKTHIVDLERRGALP